MQNGAAIGDLDDVRPAARARIAGATTIGVDDNAVHMCRHYNARKAQEPQVLTAGIARGNLSVCKAINWEGMMAEQLIVKNLPFIRVLPAWAQELSYKYLSKTANLYVIHGNITDFLPHKMREGEELLKKYRGTEDLKKAKKTISTYKPR